jgi:hypothetical protein
MYQGENDDGCEEGGGLAGNLRVVIPNSDLAVVLFW